jgi:uracil-DNA glycosylase
VQRPAPSSLEADIAATLDWWREAGVDALFGDEPLGWLADPAAAEEPARPARTISDRPKPVAPSEPTIGGPRSAWPQDLETFREWWLAEPSLDEGGLAPRVAPVGMADAELMILVAMPEEADRETLLSGPHGKLLDEFLNAAGLPAEKIYRAAVLPRHTPLADWEQIERQGMGDVLANHVALARPKRVIAFGRNILPLCGHDPAQGAQKLQTFNHEGGRIPALFEAGLERLLGNWQLRARFWRRWLEWTDTDAWRDAQG